MFRKHVVLACGGYTGTWGDNNNGGDTGDDIKNGGSTEGDIKEGGGTPVPAPDHPTIIDTIEDYHLWLRILALYPCR